MPYTSNDLKTAIDNSDHSLVTEIINSWPKDGKLSTRLKVDELCKNALLYALFVQPPAEEIIRLLVELRTDNGIPAININERLTHKQSALSIVLDKHLIRDDKLRLNIFKLLFAQIDKQNKRILNLSEANANNHKHKPLLFLAYQAHKKIFATLLKAVEEKTGLPILDCNQIIENPHLKEKNITLIDLIEQDKTLSNDEKQWQTKLVREAGGLSFDELRLRAYKENFSYLNVKLGNYEFNNAMGLEAIAYVKQINFLGAVNRKEDVEKRVYLKKHGYRARFFTLLAQTNAKSAHLKDRTMIIAKSILSKGTGCCGEQTSLALLYLITKGKFNLSQIEVKYKDRENDADAHTFLVIDLPLDFSNFSQSSALSDSVIIVDPWENDCVPMKYYAAFCEKLELEVCTTKVVYNFLADGITDLDGSAINCANRGELITKVVNFLSDNERPQEEILQDYLKWEKMETSLNPTILPTLIKA